MAFFEPRANGPTPHGLSFYEPHRASETQHRRLIEVLDTVHERYLQAEADMQAQLHSAREILRKLLGQVPRPAAARAPASASSAGVGVGVGVGVGGVGPPSETTQ